jgi:clan AA aspartic protease (TIGR02281 family)
MRAFDAWLAFALLVATPAGADGEIYRWTDAEGGVHFTRDLRTVPPAARGTAVEGARVPAPSRLQTYGPAPGAEGGAGAPPTLFPRSAASAVAQVGGRSLQIPFVRNGTLMLVQVLLNDRIEAPFLVDTGASGISIPDSVARKLGVRIDADTPRLKVQTASGIVSEPLIQLESVQVGPARVEGLAALVNSSMEIGLLGGSFFNNFVYEVDAAASVITLRLNEGVRGGLAEGQWRERFRGARAELVRLTEYVADQGEEAPRRAELERSLRALHEAFEALEREANAADVPRSWRE